MKRERSFVSRSLPCVGWCHNCHPRSTSAHQARAQNDRSTNPSDAHISAHLFVMIEAQIAGSGATGVVEWLVIMCTAQQDSEGGSGVGLETGIGESAPTARATHENFVFGRSSRWPSTIRSTFSL